MKSHNSSLSRGSSSIGMDSTSNVKDLSNSCQVSRISLTRPASIAPAPPQSSSAGPLPPPPSRDQPRSLPPPRGDEIWVTELGIETVDLGLGLGLFPFEARLLGAEVDDAFERQRHHVAAHKKLHGASGRRIRSRDVRD